MSFVYKWNYMRITLFIGSLLLLMNCAEAVHRCYVCGSGTSSSGSVDVGNVPSCDRFDATDDKNVWAEFKRDCPPKYNGCSTISSTTRGGEHQKVNSRSCEKEAFNDCQVANNVKYCYCNKSLCNGKIKTSVQPDFNDDDEDGDIEGSGSSMSSLTTIAPRVSVVAHSTATTIAPVFILVLTYALYY